MTASFYADFEKSFRGSHAEIKDRLKTYLPFVRPFLDWDGPYAALDLGCGRGEWLDLMRDIGLNAKGVDLDEGMLAQARALGLTVIQEDALQALVALPSNSQVLVTGFHLAEHVDFEVLKELVREAHRVLRPGGLLILETPNPENITVATNYFYIDPTHVRPLPPDLLAFLPKYFNFHRTKIVRLQEDPGLLNAPVKTIAQILNGVSPDYAVIAQKHADPSVLVHWDTIFEQSFGITLETLSNRYDEQLQASSAAYQEQVRQLSEQLQASNAAYQEQVRQLSEQLQASNAAYQEQVNLWHHRFMEVIESRSWRITAPLRAVKNFFLKVKKNFLRDSKSQSTDFSSSSVGLIFSIRHKVAAYTRRLPFVHRYLAAGARALGLLKNTEGQNAAILGNGTLHSNRQTVPGSFSVNQGGELRGAAPLTHREQMIFDQLMQAAYPSDKAKS